MNLLDTNRDICFICGKFDGAKLFCCDNCPRVNHRRCITDKSLRPPIDENKSTKWYCPPCRLGATPTVDFSSFYKNFIGYSLEMEETEDSCERAYKNYLQLFDLGKSRLVATSLPSLGTLILQLELKLNSFQLNILANAVKNFIPGSATLYHWLSIPRELSDLKYLKFLRTLRDTIGADIIEVEIQALCNGGYSTAISMAPSINFFFRRCSRKSCQEYRYFHTFCSRCGLIFNINDEYAALSAIKLQYCKGDIASGPSSDSSTLLATARKEVLIKDDAKDVSNKRKAEVLDLSSDLDDASLCSLLLGQCSSLNEDPLLTLIEKLTPEDPEMPILRGFCAFLLVDIRYLTCSDNAGLRYIHLNHARADKHMTNDANHHVITLGGDLLFLLRNLAGCSSGIVAFYVKRLLKLVSISAYYYPLIHNF